MNTSREVIINLCDRPIEYNQAYFEGNVKNKNYILVGSYTCPNYFSFFINSKLAQKIKNFDIVVPIFPEHLYSQIIESSKFYSIIKKARTVVVNDWGMLKRLVNLKDINLRLGRLFFRDYRDHRYEEYDNSEYISKMMNTIQIAKDIGMISNEVESDIITKKLILPSKIKVYLHFPYRQVSMSHICEFAAIGKSLDEKFIPNDKCFMQCKNQIFIFEKSGYIKVGNNVYNKLQEEEEIKDLLSEYNVIFTPKW